MLPGADFSQLLAKAELHVHLEGTLEPELMFALAERNGVALPYSDLASVKAAYDFGNLQDFLDLYYAACKVLRNRQDFRDLTVAYLDRAARDNVRHVELFVDPQTHTSRGIAIGTVIDGICDGLAAGSQRHGITSSLIPNFLRHVSAEDAMRTLEDALPTVIASSPGVLTPQRSATRPPSSPRCSALRRGTAFTPSCTPVRRDRRSTFGRPWTSGRSASTMASGPSRIRG